MMLMVYPDRAVQPGTAMIAHGDEVRRQIRVPDLSSPAAHPEPTVRAMQSLRHRRKSNCLPTRYPTRNSEEGSSRRLPPTRISKEAHLLDSLEIMTPRSRRTPGAIRSNTSCPRTNGCRSHGVSMLGEKWREVHRSWLNRPGNLTLTGYNSEYQDHSFDEKKTIKGGFSESAVRLNKFVREQPVWTAGRNGSADS
jgi:hypothetical protein